MSTPRKFTNEELATVKNAGVSMCLQEEQRLGRQSMRPANENTIKRGCTEARNDSA